MVAGKSYLIMCLRKHIMETYSPDAVEVCAPTGTAAFNIHGKTIHKAMKLPVPLPSNTLVPLQGEALVELQRNMGAVKLLIVDEMSMVGRSMLRCIDSRLREVHPHNRPIWRLWPASTSP